MKYKCNRFPVWIAMVIYYFCEMNNLLVFFFVANGAFQTMRAGHLSLVATLVFFFHLVNYSC